MHIYALAVTGDSLSYNVIYSSTFLEMTRSEMRMPMRCFFEDMGKLRGGLNARMSRLKSTLVVCNYLLRLPYRTTPSFHLVFLQLAVEIKPRRLTATATVRSKQKSLHEGFILI